MNPSLSSFFVDGEIVRTRVSVILYGAGNIGRDVLRVFSAAGIRIECILDQGAAAGDARDGIPVYSLDACPVEHSRRPTIPVVVSIFNRSVDVTAVARTLHSHGFGTVVSFIGVHGLFAEALGDRFWLTDRKHLERAHEDVGRAEQVWADDRSRTIFRRLIELRRSASYHPDIAPRSGERQYLPADVPGWLPTRPLRFVDCGAYRGDTLDDLLDADAAIEASVHFEPDIENFAVLVDHVRGRVGNTGVAALSWPCAVGAECAIVGFSHGGDEASRLAPEAAGRATVVALDDVLVGWRPTLIKMDIEGSEIDALRGARSLIAANRPHVAVCLYHRPDHLWQIPLLLSSWPFMRGYRYYLRSHGFDGFDTVLYAVPDERRRAHEPFNEVRS